ncbi:MAG: hypothetical protein JKY54_15820, partial [Flavobacteriales bacterium]|nr:hypothetical protein [Flavobacteriales bacterium]
MKLLLSLAFTACSMYALAGKPILQYSIKSDTVDSSVPSGKCIIQGKVTFHGTPLKNALVATCDSRLRVRTNDVGEYSITVSALDSCIYMFKSTYDEVVTRMYDFKSQHRVNLDFYATQNIIMMDVDKPVIYVYAEQPTDCQLQLSPKSQLTFTYPEYKDGWAFTTSGNGTI